MSSPTLSLEQVSAMAKKYSVIRQLEAPKPATVLRELKRYIKKTLVPFSEDQHVRSENALYALHAFTEGAVLEADKQQDTAMEDTKRAITIVEEIKREIEQMSRELATLPPESPRRKDLLGKLELRGSELELQGRRLKTSRSHLLTAQEKLEQLVPSITYVQHRVDTAGKQLRWMALLTISALGSDLSLLVPVALAYGLTVIFDRITPVIESVTLDTLPKGNHDFVLFCTFALASLLTPTIDRFGSALCWKSFDQTMRTVESLIDEMRDQERNLLEAQREMSRVSPNQQRSTR